MENPPTFRWPVRGFINLSVVRIAVIVLMFIQHYFAAVFPAFIYVYTFFYPLSLLMIGALFSTEQMPRGIEFWLLAALLGWHTLCGIFNKGLAFHTQGWRLLEICMYFMLFMRPAETAPQDVRRELNWLCPLLVWPMTLMALCGLCAAYLTEGPVYVFFTGISKFLSVYPSTMQGGRLYLFSQHPNTTAEVSMLISLLALYQVAVGRRIRKIVYGLATVLLYMVLVVTKSLTTYLGLCVAMGWIVFIWIQRRRIIRARPALLRWIVGLFVGAALMAALWYINRTGYQYFFDKIQRMLNAKDGRNRIWSIVLRYFKENPRSLLTGVSPDSSSTALQYILKDNPPSLSTEISLGGIHNSYLEMILSVGLPGFLLWMLLFGLMIARVVRVSLKEVKPGLDGAILMGIVFACLVMAFAESVFFGVFNHCLQNYLFFFGLGGAAALTQTVNNKSVNMAGIIARISASIKKWIAQLLFSLKPNKKKITTALILTATYACGVILRIILLHVHNVNPITMGDEALYVNLARGIATSGETLFRGQPVFYQYLLYPLVIAPLYALPQSVDMHRAIQVVNAILMNLAIFPVWLFTKRVAKKSSAAWVVAVMAIMIPEMALTEVAMVENISYPLTQFVLLFAYLSFEKERSLIYPILTGVGSFLLYFTKGNLAVIGISISIFFLIDAISKRNFILWRRFAVETVLFIVFCVIGAIVANMFQSGQTAGLADNVYGKLIDAPLKAVTTGTIPRGINGLILYAFFFPVACLILPVAFPLAHRKSLQPSNRKLFDITLSSIAALILMISFSIYLVEYTGSPFYSRIHIRYLAAVILALLALSFAPELDGKRLNTFLFGMFAFFVVGFSLFGNGAISGGGAHPVDGLTLSLLVESSPSNGAEKILTLIFAVCCVIMGAAIHKKGWNARIKAAFSAMLILWWGLANVSGYAHMRHNMDPLWKKDAMEIAAWAKDRDVLFVTRDEAYFWNPATAFDVQMRKDVSFAKMGDVFDKTLPGGVYQPFVPPKYGYETPGRTLANPRYIIMDINTANSVLPVTPANEEPFYTANRLYMGIRIDEGRPWIHSGFSRFNNWYLSEGSRLSVFDEALCNQEEITVMLNASSNVDGAAITIQSGANTIELPVWRTLHWITVALPTVEKGLPFHVDLRGDQEIYVQTYRVQ